MSHLTEIPRLLEQARQEFCFSGYSLYLEKDGVSKSFAGGVTGYWPQATSVKEDTWFDIGSITKVIVATSLFAQAEQNGKIQLSDPLSEAVPEWHDTAYGKLTFQKLFSHTSGLKAWAPTYERTRGTSLEDWFLENEKNLFEAKPGEKAIYSDLGMLLIGIALEHIFKDWPKAYDDYVAKPLKLKEVTFAPVTGAVAATEYCVIRQRVLVGEVFDENTWGLGGKSVHAGLFATARGLAPFCQGWLKARAGKSGWLNQNLAMQFSSKSGEAKGSSWAYGWDTKSESGSSAGTLFSGKTFGHLGYTGCSLWIDPEANGFAIFLTNRIHPSRYDQRIRALRPKLHDEIAKAWRQEWKA